MGQAVHNVSVALVSGSTLMDSTGAACVVRRHGDEITANPASLSPATAAKTPKFSTSGRKTRFAHGIRAGRPRARAPKAQRLSPPRRGVRPV